MVTRLTFFFYVSSVIISMLPVEQTQRSSNLKKMLEFVLLSDERDVARWIEDYIQPAIEKNEVENFEPMLTKTRSQIEKKIPQKTNNKKSFQDVYFNDPDETETEDSESDCATRSKITKHSGRSKGQKGGNKTVRKAKSTKAKTKSKDRNMEDLIASIRNKNGQGNPLASIAARYGTSLTEEDPIDNEQFEKLRSKYTKKK
ncbi:unnamed protein product [Pseudo-nitzschia multistriata]|uniref:Uncharacterized protein n=1 Tax=Pseudo-nitzschia multistriata TaxID=183589 RepID=A0A448Z5P4_9STRA|nr:unnamed protein product [Pseudo-nitzschia multistriata]